MKKLLVFITVLIGLTSLAQKGPKIEFKEETINYGEVEKGKDDGIRVFEFTNTGDEPLLIKNAKSSCGCTVPEWPKDPIAPGAKGQIKVQYNMNPGPIRKMWEEHLSGKRNWQHQLWVILMFQDWLEKNK